MYSKCQIFVLNLSKHIVSNGILFLFFTLLSVQSNWAQDGSQPLQEQVNVNARYLGNFKEEFQTKFIEKFEGADFMNNDVNLGLIFTVNSKGSVENISIKGIDSDDVKSAASAILSKMNNWQVAIKDGVAVDTEFNLPILIEVERIKGTSSNKLQKISQPHYPGGVNAFLNEFYQIRGPIAEANFVGDRLSYFVKVSINNEGIIYKAEIVGLKNKRLQKSFEEDFLDITNRMKKWYPGTINGKAVNANFAIKFVTTVEHYEL